MSKLNELLAQHCPDGVEYKELQEVLKIKNGKDYKTFGEGEYPVYGSGGVMTYVDRYAYDKPSVLIPRKGSLDKLYYVDSPFWNVDTIFYTEIDETQVVPRYVYHCLLKAHLEKLNTAGGVPSLTQGVLNRVKIPVPSIEVQSEIVRILDDFTKLSTELSEQLSTEISVRRKQYEYYRDKLLDFDKEIPQVTLKEIATDMYRGSGIKRDQVTDDGIPCVRYGEIYTTYNTWFKDCVSHTQLEYVSSPKYFGHGDILFAITGESVEDIAKSVVYLGNEECLAGGDIVVMKHNQNPRYMAHVLSTTYAREQKSRGKVKNKVVHSNVPSIEGIRIPIPPLDVQERYADVLDNFEKICNDLNIGLPAEIEARQKQYEYYRDLLLTFAETGSSVLTDRQTDRQTE
jgi:type I restriction enzyme S subunit